MKSESQGKAARSFEELHIQFPYIAKGSCGEVRAQSQVALDQGYMAPHQHAALVDLARRTSGMISNFTAHLQKSDYRGERFSRPQRNNADTDGPAFEQ